MTQQIKSVTVHYENGTSEIISGGEGYIQVSSLVGPKKSVTTYACFYAVKDKPDEPKRTFDPPRFARNGD